MKFPAGITAAEPEKAVRAIVDVHPYISCRFNVNENNNIVQEPTLDFALEIPIREMSRADFVAYREILRDLVNEYKGEVFTLIEFYGAAKKSISLSELAPENLFVVLYTSGPTGLSEGCQLEHRNLVAYVHGVISVKFYTRDDKIVTYASFGFDANISDVFCTLLNGGTVYLIPDDIRMNLNELVSYFEQVEITALLLTTQVGVQFLQNYPHHKFLIMLVMGGEKLPPVKPDSLNHTIVNGYGSTENCCNVSLFPIRHR